MPRNSVFFPLVCLAFACSGPTGTAPQSPTRPASTDVAVTHPALPDPAPPAFRLPGEVRPTRASLELTILPDQDHFDGIARFDLAIASATPVIWLHATDLTQPSATIDGKPARVVTGNEDLIGVIPAIPLQAGTATLELHYRAGIDRERSRGVYADKEGADWYAYTFFEAIDARRAFPCFDEPGFKIPWQLTFHVRREHVALANAPVLSETDEPGGMKRVVIAETKPLPSYLVAFVVGPFDLVDGGVAGRAHTPVRFIVPRGRGAETRYAREVTPRVVTLLEDYFDMPYPYEKLDVAVVPRYWGTMEHPGIVAMGQPLTLIAPDQETQSRKEHYANILTHELAHYWFGDVVTMAWWDDTWLNESLASWLDIKLTDQLEPAWHYADDALALANGAMNTDQLLAARAMRQPVDDNEAIQASFDNSTTYAKGAAVLRMFEQWIGPDQFRTFIRSYIRAHAWGTATADDFITALTAAAGADAATAFRTFLDQPGVPVVDLELRCKGGATTLHLEQRRSLLDGATDPSSETWHIPVCVRHGSRRRQQRACWLLTTSATDVSLAGPCPEVLVPNAGGDGYYRSSLAERTAPSTVTGLPRRERITLLNDAAAAWQRGQLEISRLFELGLQMQDDRDPRVARRAANFLWFFDQDHFDDADRRRYARMVRAIFGEKARELGWRRRDSDDDDLHDLRRQLVGAVAEHDPKLREEAARLVEAFLRDGASVPDDIVDTVLWVTATTGDRQLFDRLLASARATPDLRLRRRLLRTLGAFRDPALTAAARDVIVAPDLDQRESLAILYVQLSVYHTRDDAWSWTRAHLPALLSEMRDDEAGAFIGGLAEVYCDRTHRAEASTWLTPFAASVDGARNQLAQALESADHCIRTSERDLPAVRRFLARY